MRAVVVIVALSVAGGAVAAEKCKPGDAKNITVNAKNDEWTDTGLVLQKGDLLLVEAFGDVVLGGWMGKATPNGAGGSSELGKLMLKLGDGGGEKVGARHFTTEGAGAVKVKIYDTKYEDNDGTFVVIVRRIPAACVPPMPEAKFERTGD